MIEYLPFRGVESKGVNKQTLLPANSKDHVDAKHHSIDNQANQTLYKDAREIRGSKSTADSKANLDF